MRRAHLARIGGSLLLFLVVVWVATEREQDESRRRLKCHYVAWKKKNVCDGGVGAPAAGGGAVPVAAGGAGVGEGDEEGEGSEGAMGWNGMVWNGTAWAVKEVDKALLFDQPFTRCFGSLTLEGYGIVHMINSHGSHTTLHTEGMLPNRSHSHSHGLKVPVHSLSFMGHKCSSNSRSWSSSPCPIEPASDLLSLWLLFNSSFSVRSLYRSPLSHHHFLSQFLSHFLSHSHTAPFFTFTFPFILHSSSLFTFPPSYPHPLIPSYPHPIIPSYPHTLIPSSHHTLIPSSHHTLIPSYPHPIIPSSHHPIIPSYPQTSQPRPIAPSSVIPRRSFSPEEYPRLKLLGGSMSWTADLSRVGCKCIATVYLVPLADNSKPGSMNNYYCDASGVGASHATRHTPRATRHTSHACRPLLLACFISLSPISLFIPLCVHVLDVSFTCISTSIYFFQSFLFVSELMVLAYTHHTSYTHHLSRITHHVSLSLHHTSPCFLLDQIGGVNCDELDMEESNRHAFHTVLHTAYDANGKNGGFGGGQWSWNGPRYARRSMVVARRIMLVPRARSEEREGGL